MATQQSSNAPEDLPVVPGEDATAASVLGSGQTGEANLGSSRGAVPAGGSLAAALPGTTAASEGADNTRTQRDAVRQAADAAPAPNPSSR